MKKASAELPSSQPGAEQAPIDRRKQPDASAVINEQWTAAQKSAAHSLRRFEYQDVEIESVNGTIKCKMWVSEEEPRIQAEKEPEIFKCEVCGKEFDKRQKVLLHARFHNKS